MCLHTSVHSLVYYCEAAGCGRLMVKNNRELFWNCCWVCEYSACGKGDTIAGWSWTSKRGGVNVGCKGLGRQIPQPASCGERTKPPSVISQDDAIWDLPN